MEDKGKGQGKEEKEKEEKKEKEVKEEEEEEEKKVVVGDNEGGLHQIPLLIAASMPEVWKEYTSSPSTTVQLPLTKEVLMHVLLYQRCCVCRHVKVLEEIENAREKLKSKTKQDPSFSQTLKDAALTVGSSSLTLFLECCGELASFESLEEVEGRERGEAFERQEREGGEGVKKPVFTTLGALSAEEEKFVGTLNVGSVKWVGPNGPEKEEDLSFSWLNPKKDEPPAKIQANKIIENELHDSETVVQHLEELL